MTEDKFIEFKSGFNEEAMETLVAFANTNGGKVIVGIKNDGTPIKNFEIKDEDVQRWLNEFKTKTQPALIADANIIRVNGKNVVEFSVQEFPVKPVAFRGRYYKRINNSTHQLNTSEIAEVYMRSMQYSWDAYYSNEYTVKDLDLDKVQRFIDRVNTAKRFNLTGTPTECLEKLKYISGDKVTNAAVLLFAKEGSVYNVHLGRFKTPSMIIDDKMLRLTLFDAVEETQKYLISQMKVAFEITGVTTQRTEILEYPLPAIRELILNCLIHRDYLSPIDVQIKVFDNYITFYNPGKLYGNLTIDDLKTDKYQAVARNKMLAEAFYLTGDIEKYGSGFRRIRDELAEYPTMKLEYEEISNGFLLTIGYTERKTSTINVPINVPINKRQDMILIEIKNNPDITINTLAEKFGVNEKTIKREISQLKKENKITRIDSRKAGKWLIVD
jgi:ATP-dependent DNA helicase RecG